MPEQPDVQRKSFFDSGWFTAILAGVGIIALVLSVGFSSKSLFDFSQFPGERVNHGGTDGQVGGGTLASCTSIPSEWSAKLDAAATQSGAPASLIAAIMAGGEHYSWSQKSAWPTYRDTYPYSSAENPTIHDGPDNGGWVRGPAQFKEATFAAYSPDAKAQGAASRFNTGYKVESFIEQTFPSLVAAGSYLSANGGKVGDTESSIKKAIWHYNHADWYVERVYGLYQDYLQCSTVVAAASQGTVYDGGKACPVGSGQADWGPVTAANPHVPTYPGHEGIDTFGPKGTPIYSVTNGRVVTAGAILSGPNSGGIRVWIDDTQGHYWFYQHMQSNLLVSVGDTVKAGQQIGYMSDTGARGTPVHLHLGIARNPHAGTSDLNWTDWYYPYDFLHDVPCLAKTLKG